MATPIEVPKLPCPECRYDCDALNNCILCAYCSNTYHLKCTTLSKKKFSSLRRGIGIFKCKMCSKKLKCTKCTRQSNIPHLKGLYCVNCLEYHCKHCLPLSSEQVCEYLNNKNSFYCEECSVQHFCPFCSKLCGDHPDAESSIHCDSCKSWIHLKCTKINVRQFKKFGRSSDPYFCTKCIHNNMPLTTNVGNDFFSKTSKRIRKQPFENTPCQLCIECPIECDNCSYCTDQFRVCDNCIDCKTVDVESLSKIICDSGIGNIGIVHFNIRSLSKNIKSIEELLYTMNRLPDVICISETKLDENPEEDDVNIKLDGYQFFDNPSTTNFGGTGIFVSEKHLENTSHRTDLEINIPGECEASFIEIKFANGKSKSNQTKNVIVGALYRHPHDNHEEFFEKISETFTKIDKKCSILLMGDININTSVTNNPIVARYKNTLLGFGLRNFISSQSTRITSTSETTIDHFITNLNCNQIKSGVIQFEASDHLPIFGIAELSLPKPPVPAPSYKRVFDINKKDQFCNLLQQKLSCNPTLTTGNFDPNTAMNDLIQAIDSSYKTIFPLQKVTKRYLRKFRKPWITASILKLIRIKHKLYKVYLDKRDAESFEMYKSQRNIVKRHIEQAKRNYYKNMFIRCRDDKKKTWKCLNTVLNKGSKKTSCLPTDLVLKENGKLSCPKDVVNELNEHFVKKGPLLASKIKGRRRSYRKYLKRNPKTMYFTKIIETEVSKIIFDLELGKSIGYDGISAEILKWCEPYILNHLTNIFNKCAEKGIYPNMLKIAKVTAIHKGGDRSDADNFRPISVLSQINKVFEKLIHKRILSFLERYKIISKQQFGFRKQHSTSHSITCLYEKLITNLEKGLDSAVLFVDLKSAFDTVDNKILLDKLDFYGIRNSTLKLLSSYLSGRKQYIKSGSIESSILDIIYGVPQGSVLGPLLFILYINDLSESSKFDPVLYADDAALVISANNIKKLRQKINREAKLFFSWLVDNKLTLNYKKTKFMIISNKKYDKALFKKFRLNINKCNIKLVTKFKYLGVILDCKLTWRNHIEFLQTKVSHASGILFKTRHLMPLHVSKLIYNTLIDSYLRYGVTTWGTAAAYLTDGLLSTQNRSLRSLLFPQFTTSSISNHYRYLKVLCLNDLYTLELSKFMHSIYFGYNPTSFDNHIEVSNHRYATRLKQNAHFALSKPRTESGKKSVRYAGVKCWTNLSSDLKEISNRKMFSSKLKQRLNPAFD